MTLPDPLHAEAEAERIINDWVQQHAHFQGNLGEVIPELVHAIAIALHATQQAEREQGRKVLKRLKEELPRLLMPSSCGGSLTTCERLIDAALEPPT